MNDLDHVAGLRADIAEPPSARLAAGRARLTAAISAETRPVTTRSRRIWVKRPVVAICAAATAAGIAAAGLALTSGPAAVTAQQGTVVTAAWTVREDANGTVTIYLRQYANPARLQQTLRADGVNAIVRGVPYGMRTVTLPVGVPGSKKPPLRVPGPTCMYAATNNAPQAVQQAVAAFVVALPGRDLPARIIIHPDAMPQGSALLLPFVTGMPAAPKNGDTGIRPLTPVVLNNDTVPACVPFTKPAPPSAAPQPKAKQ
jgi:hypothetical protein